MTYSIEHIIDKSYIPDKKILEMIPKDIAGRYNIVPLWFDDSENSLHVACESIYNAEVITELKRYTHKFIRLEHADAEQIKTAFDVIYRQSVNTGTRHAPSAAMKQSALEAAVYKDDDSQAIDIVESILNNAIKQHASDIHIENQDDYLRVRFRHDGLLRDYKRFGAGLHQSVTARIKVLAGADIAERRKTQEGRFFHEFENHTVDVRVSIIPAISGEKTVMRLLDRRNGIISLDSLGFDCKKQKMLLDIIASLNGIILVTGPTGSGKSTTLYSLLEKLNVPEKNIITIEDPVEYMIEGITQIQINETKELTFASALRAILRQDPDIIMVGEIRDTETAQLALRAALTGHLVLATLHTNDAVSAVSRLIDLHIPPALLASTLRAVIAQRLVRKLCTKCRKERTGISQFGIKRDQTVYEHVGCEECRGTGYEGRTVISEIMVSDKKLSQLIADGADENQLREYALHAGMLPMRNDALSKVLQGVTSIEEMYLSTGGE